MRIFKLFGWTLRFFDFLSWISRDLLFFSRDFLLKWYCRFRFSLYLLVRLLNLLDLLFCQLNAITMYNLLQFILLDIEICFLLLDIFLLFLSEMYSLFVLSGENSRVSNNRLHFVDRSCLLTLVWFLDWAIEFILCCGE